jgi:hypothetical protein
MGKVIDPHEGAAGRSLTLAQIISLLWQDGQKGTSRRAVALTSSPIAERTAPQTDPDSRRTSGPAQH